MMLQRKRGSLGQSKPLGATPVEKKHVVELSHTYPLLWPLKDKIYAISDTPVPTIGKGLIRDAQPSCFSFAYCQWK